MSKYSIKNTAGMFDLLKGLGMFMIMLSHTYGIEQCLGDNLAPGSFIENRGLFVFAIFLMYHAMSIAGIPTLFIVSGYGFRKTKMKECVKKQWNMLITPYLIAVAVTAIAHFISYYVLYRNTAEGMRLTLRRLLGGLLGLPAEKSLFGMTISGCGNIWFLLSLAIGYIVFNALANRFDGKALLAASFVSAVIGWGIGFLTEYEFWCIPQSLVAVFYLCIGYLAKKGKLFTVISNLPAKVKILCTPCVVAVIVALTLAGPFFNMALGVYSFGPISIAFVGVSALLQVYFFLLLNRFTGPVTSFFREIGSKSLYVMCVHSIELMSIGGYEHYRFVNNWQGSVYVRSLIIFGVRVFVVLAVTYCFVRIKDKSFLAKKINLLTSNTH